MPTDEEIWRQSVDMKLDRLLEQAERTAKVAETVDSGIVAFFSRAEVQRVIAAAVVIFGGWLTAHM